MRRYEIALATLPEEHQEAIIMRFDLGFTYKQIAEELGIPSANAARTCVTRAIVHLEEALRGTGSTG